MERTDKSPESTRIKRLFDKGFRRLSEEQSNGRVISEVPAHNLGMKEEGAETEALIESGHLQRIGEVPFYTTAPSRGVVVKVLIAGSLVAAGFELGVRHGKDIKTLANLAKRRPGREKFTP